MLFNSYAFVAFLLVVVVVYHAAPLRLRSCVVLAASLVFYATFGLPHIATLLASCAVAWWSAKRIRATSEENDRARTRSVAVAVIVLLAALSLFKYAGALSKGALSLAAPIGISYYTFKLISYVVDTYWGKLEKDHGYFAVLRYAAFFPQILSGPIQRPADFFEQEETPRAAEVPMIVRGLQFMLFGFFEKLVVADRAALLVDQVYTNPAAHPPEVLWIAPYVYAIQLYADFSGFTHLAIGAGCMIGIEGPPNFDNPYYAANIQDFWRRWHMSLSSWLGDYVFTPLRMSLRNWGDFGLVIAITINMLAIGTWHGPSLTFVLFGAINALYMSVSALTLTKRNKWFKKRPGLTKIRRVLGALVVFHLMVIAFIPFRANSIADTITVFRGFLTGAPAGLRLLPHPMMLLRTVDGFGMQHLGLLVVGIVVMEAVHLGRAMGFAPKFEARPTWLRWGAYYALFVATAIFAMARSSAFIYFKF